MAVKWRFFLHLSGGDDLDSERVYRWHIEERSGTRMKLGLSTDRWKRCAGDYVAASKELHASMVRSGFMGAFAIPIDPNGELLGGAHRLACALAIGIETVPVDRLTHLCWAPTWNEAWFVEHGVSEADLARIKADWETMRK